MHGLLQISTSSLILLNGNSLAIPSLVNLVYTCTKNSYLIILKNFYPKDLAAATKVSLKLTNSVQT